MVSPLDKKLRRDLWRMKGQATAIGAVIAVGVLMLVMMTGLTASISQTRATYYDRYRLADIFATVARAPERVEARIAALPGVSSLQSRVSGQALIDIPNEDLPIQAQALSLPDQGRPVLNDVYLTSGRMPEAQQSDEILLLHSFATARGLNPGDRLRATMNGARRSFRIVGLAQSPEFLYVTAPGEFIPDDARFAVIWMGRASLAATYDMNGAFNSLLLGLSRGADENAVLDAVDQILAPFGGTGAYPRDQQMSDRFISEEISGLKAASKVVPPLFLAVAAFLLYIVINRMVQSEREEIGLLKAFGYTNIEVGAHYARLVLAIAFGGAIAGCMGGVVAGRAMVGVFVTYYKFPFLVFELEPASFVIGVTTSTLAAAAGGVLVLRHVFALTPATAMRPPAPPDYSRTGQIGHSVNRFLDQPSRMVLRRLTRQPGRIAGAVIGVACGMGLSAAMMTIYAGFDRTVDLTFGVIDRSDVTVTFTHAVSDKTLFELRRMPGVEQAEAVRHVPVVLSLGQRSHRGSLTGLPPSPELNRALNAQALPIDLPRQGIVLSTALADLLNAKPGDLIGVDVREGRQPLIRVPVAAIATALLGAPAYMDLEALNRMLREPRRISGAYLSIDQAHAKRIYADLRDMPTIAGISVKSQARVAFEVLMNTGAGAIRYVMGVIAFIITFGIIYNAARIAFAERARDLASLRVIGFSHGETAFILLAELGAVILLALPIGALLGYGLAFNIASGFSTELYQIPVLISPRSYGTAMLVVIGAALFSGWLVKRDLDRLDLISALKTRE
ncbi:ABC transporter permease [Rhodobacteraceae bacterium M382]|nr:ABC transporter permease [Rhodobacteraceae bacterium M382]